MRGRRGWMSLSEVNKRKMTKKKSALTACVYLLASHFKAACPTSTIDAR